MNCKLNDFSQLCLGFRIRKLNRIVTSLYDEALKEVGMTVNQLGILAVIASCQSIQASVLARDILDMEKSTLSRNLTLLKRHGWINIEMSPKDQRMQNLTLTHLGLRKLEHAYPAWQQAQEKVKVLLGEEGTEWIYRIADQL